MSLTVMDEAQIKEKEELLLSQVPEKKSIGNLSLRRALVWEEEFYWPIRNRLIDKGILQKGGGKGGSVRRVHTSDARKDPVAPGNPVTPQSERDLYEPMAKVIRDHWSSDAGMDDVMVEITAQGGRRADGKWSRPDITLASYKTYPYVPGRHFDLITFEIKPTEAVDVTIVYEALAHRRAATRAYALMHIPDELREEFDELLEEIVLESKRVGIGVIVASDPSDYDTWEELVEASRHEPEPQRLNDFLSKQVSPVFREQIVKWFR